MAIYLISYDLLDPLKEPALLEYLKNATMATKSSYLLNTGMPPEQVVTRIRSVTADRANVYVLTIAPPYSGWGPPDVNQWLQTHLG